jgi:hypothetical protein
MIDLSNIINVDGVEYDLDNLTDEAKAQVTNIRFSDERILQLKNEIAISDTARQGYLNALKVDLASSIETDK